jgi:tetratricopeptide (TPR) repeat protein
MMMIFNAFFKQPLFSITGGGSVPQSSSWEVLPLQQGLQALTPARQALWQQRNPQLCLRLLPLNPLYHTTVLPATWLNHLLVDTASEAYLASGQYQRAAKLLERYNLPERAGWAWILAGDLQQAFHQWQPFLVQAQAVAVSASITTASPEEHPTKASSSVVPLTPQLASQAGWLVTQWGLLNNQFYQWPTLLQLRNALENDLTQLIQAERLTVVDAYLAKLDWLAQVNIECYKLVGRSLLYLGLFNPAYQLLLKAHATIVIDAEGYYHLGQYYVACKQYQHATLMLRQCLWVNPAYQPAQVLLQVCQT